VTGIPLQFCKVEHVAFRPALAVQELVDMQYAQLNPDHVALPTQPARLI
jgi:hypothetical protein